MKRFVIIFGMVVALVGFMAVANAGATAIDFTVAAANSGTISYATLNGDLTGVNITVNEVQEITPLGASYPVTNGVLSFTTGVLTSTTDNSWIFDGGTITLTGTVDGVTGTLLTGDISSVTVYDVGGTFRIAGAVFFDTKNEAFLKLWDLGELAGLTWDGNFNISFYATGGLPPSTFESTSVFSGDVINNIPEPATLLLLGVGMLGLGFVSRRKKV